MSEEYFKISQNEIDEFINDKFADRPCPLCGKKELFHLLTVPGDSMTLPVDTDEHIYGGAPNSAKKVITPALALACPNCGNIILIARHIVERWLKTKSIRKGE